MVITAGPRRTVWIYFSSRAFFRLVKVRPHPMIAALYPVVVLLAQLEIGLLLGWLIWWVLSVAGGLPSIIGLSVGLIGFIGLMRFFYAKDRYVFAYYLINDYGFTARHKGRYPDALRARISEFATRIESAC